jgi:hypothetical protein
MYRPWFSGKKLSRTVSVFGSISLLYPAKRILIQYNTNLDCSQFNTIRILIRRTTDERADADVSLNVLRTLI